MRNRLNAIARLTLMLLISGLLLGPVMTPAGAQDAPSEPTAEVASDESTQEPIELPSVEPTVQSEATFEPTEAPLFVVQEVNQAPNAVDDEVVIESGGIELLVMVNDSDPDSDPISIVPATLITTNGGTGFCDADKCDWTPPSLNFVGVDSFEYTITDGDLFDTALVTITYGNTPAPSPTPTGTSTSTATAESGETEVSPPTAFDDEIETTINTAVVINMLNNDFFPQLSGGVQGLTPALETTQATDHGTISCFEFDGPCISILYTPDNDFKGSDSFEYSFLTNIGASNTATVTISVIDPENNPPIANDDAQTVLVNTPRNLSILVNDTDADGDNLFVTLFESVSSVTTDHGVLTCSATIDGHCFSVRYEPEAGYEGADTFDYSITDLQETSKSATVSILVRGANQPPVTGDDNVVTLVDEPVEIAITENDSDPDGDSLVVSDYGDNVTNGTVSCVGFSGDPCARILFTPDPGFIGTAEFDYSVGDGIVLSLGHVTIEVLESDNEAPIANEDEMTVLQNTPRSLNILGNDIDPDGDDIFVTLFDANGSFETDHGILTCSGSFDGFCFNVTYTPDSGYTGPDGFDYALTDLSRFSAPAHVIINVKAANTAPVAGDDEAETRANESVDIEVLVNDSDPDGDPIFVQNSEISVENGFVDCVATSGEHCSVIRFTPDFAFTGEAGFTYELSDGIATDQATVTITVVNTAPVANDDIGATQHGIPVNIFIIGNDLDPDFQAIQMTLFDSSPTVATAHGSIVCGADFGFGCAAVEYTPNAGFSGIDTFTYQLTDGELLSNEATVTIHIRQDNLSPLANGERQTATVNTPVIFTFASLLENDSDPDGDPLQATSFRPFNGFTECFGPDAQTACTTGRFVPNQDFMGLAYFEYRVMDPFAAESRTVLFEIQYLGVNGEGNEAPNPENDQAEGPDAFPIEIDVLDNDSEPENDALHIASFTQGSNGTVTCTATNAAGDCISLTYTSEPGFDGTDEFTYVPSDSLDLAGSAGTVTMTIVQGATVQPTETQTPTATPSATQTGVPAETLTPTQTATATPTPTATEESTSTATATPTQTATEESTSTATATPTQTATEESTSTATATPTQTATGESTSTATATPTQTATEEPTSTATATPTQTATEASTSTATATPTQTTTGESTSTATATPTQTATEESTSTATATPTQTPTPTQNGDPVLQDDQFTAAENGALEVDAPGVLGNDTDPEGDALQAQLVDGPTSGTLTLNPDGSFTYTPNAGFTGIDQFTYTVAQAVTTSALGETPQTATVRITVNSAAGTGEEPAPGPTAVAGEIDDNDSDDESVTTLPQTGTSPDHGNSPSIWIVIALAIVALTGLSPVARRRRNETQRS